MTPPAPSPPRLLVSCEHGGNRVPAPYRPLFRGAEGVLASHRGWDPGALPLARSLARELRAPLRFSTVSRLLVDPNRSESSPTLFSEFTAPLAPEARERLLEAYHRRYRRRVREALGGEASGGPGPALHVSVHTFTPVLQGVRREVGIGVLFDPERDPERLVAERWIAALRSRLPGLEVRANEPYLGAADGLTTTLRSERPEDRYSGLELEVREDLLPGLSPKLLAKALFLALRSVVG